MDTSSIIEIATGLLTQLGIECRREHLGGTGGGACNLRKKHVFFLDLDADPVTQADRCVAALAALPETERLHLPPFIREQVEQRKALQGGSPAAV